MALVFALVPTPVAYQDLGALLARQPGVAARARAYLIASPFGTIHAAMFSLPRPVGTAIPHPPVYALADFDPGDIAARDRPPVARRSAAARCNSPPSTGATSAIR